MSATPDSGPIAGRLFDRYELLERIGRGAMGTVWKARDPQLHRIVALKEFDPVESDQSGLVERFQREARLAARLDHPALVPVYDVGTWQGRPYYTSRFVEGRSLDAYLGRSQRPERVVGWIAGVARALAAAHDQGIVHRDIKPGNILIDEEGSPHVTDFGLARDYQDRLARRLTETGAVLGTPYYMSPEQADGRTDAIGPAADQFALAVVLYELLTGRLPFDGDNLREILNSICEARPRPVHKVEPRLPRALWAVCRRALDKRPDRRYPTIDAFGAALEESLAGPTASAAGRLAPVGVPVALVVLVVALGLALRGPGDGPAVAPAATPPPDPAAAEAEPATLDRELVAAIDRAAATVDPFDVVRILGPVLRILGQRVEADPGAAAMPFLLGRALAIAGRWHEAESWWLETLRRDPDHAGSHLALGARATARLRLFEAADWRREGGIDDPRREALSAAAIEHLRRAFQSGLDDPLDRDLATAEVRYALDDVEGAHQLLDRAIAEHRGAPGSGRLLWRLAMTSGDLDAEGYFDGALGEPLSAPFALCLRGARRHAAGDDRRARADLEGAVARAPGLADSHAYLGWLESRLGRYRPAIESFTRALEMAPDLDDIRRQRGSCWRFVGNLEAARKDLDDVIEVDPGNATAYYDRSFVVAEEGRLEDALRDLDSCLRLDPGAFEARFDRAVKRKQVGELAGAIEDLDLILEAFPRAGQALLERGDAFRRLERFGEAIADLDRAVELLPDHAGVLSNRGVAHLEAGHAALAVADLEAALAAAPVDWAYREGCRQLLDQARRAAGQ